MIFLLLSRLFIFFLFFFNDPATTEIYTLPYTTLFRSAESEAALAMTPQQTAAYHSLVAEAGNEWRSEEHTSELQSRGHLVCRLLLEKKNKNDKQHIT